MEDIRVMIQNWLTIGTAHLLDDKRFYDIVIKSYPNRIEKQVFVDAYNTAGNAQIDLDKVYSRYEDLYFFMIYLKKMMNEDFDNSTCHNS